MMLLSMILAATLSMCPVPAYEYCQTGCDQLGDFVAVPAQTMGEAFDTVLTLTPAEKMSLSIVQTTDPRVPMLVLHRQPIDVGTDLSSQLRCEVAEPYTQPVLPSGVLELGVFPTNDPSRKLIRVLYAPCGWEGIMPSPRSK